MATLPASEFRVGILMQCGCAAQGTVTRPGHDAVVGCLVHDCYDVAEQAPDLAGRIARCSYGAHADRPSSASLAFFEHRPGHPFDRYYCGCFGWD